jgi:hypothetical protein
LIEQTILSYDKIVGTCRDIYSKKIKDYGTSWRILRPTSLTDQLFIKGQRIRTLEEKQTKKVDEGIEGEFMGLINYSIIGLIQLELPAEERLELPIDEALALYDKHIKINKELMLAKNHDYGEAWRDMRTSSMTDLILMKLYRIKQIEDNKGATLISEGIDSHYRDIINYSIFALIKLGH